MDKKPPRQRVSPSLSENLDESQGQWQDLQEQGVDKQGRPCTRIVRRWVRWSRSDIGPADHLHDASMAGRLAPDQYYTTSNMPGLGSQAASSGGGGYPPPRTAPAVLSAQVAHWHRELPDDPSEYTSTPAAGSTTSSDPYGDSQALRVDVPVLGEAAGIGEQGREEPVPVKGCCRRRITAGRQNPSGKVWPVVLGRAALSWFATLLVPRGRALLL